MTITTDYQSILPIHRRRGIASTIIGTTSIAHTLLLYWMVVSGAEPSRPVMIALQVLTSTLLGANLIGLVLGFLGARDRASKKLFPLLGLVLNAANLTTYVALAFM
jgi:Family of unknown function (DUF6142)